jgi:molybdopterin-binding protein
MQDHYLFDGTVHSNVAYGLNVRGARRYEIRTRVEKALATAALAGFEQRRADTLSGGESKRAAIARALVLRPEVLLLDEPTANIDRRNTELIEETVGRLKEEGLTVVMTTHDFSQAYKLGDNMISLVAGKLVDVSPENVFPCTISGRQARVAPDVVVNVSSTKEGPAHIAIDPEDVILSLTELSSSARNCLAGTIKRVSMEDALVKVYIDVGTELTSLITGDSLEKLKLKPGMRIYATFKAAAVHVL